MFFFIFQALTILSLAWGSPEKTFSYHLITEPSSLDSALTRGVSGAYLFNNIYSSLFTYDNDKGLVPEGAKFCKWSGQLKLVCQLNPEAKFSNGLEVKAEHYVNSFRHIFNIKSFHTELLLQLKNAKQILSDQLPTTS